MALSKKQTLYFKVLNRLRGRKRKYLSILETLITKMLFRINMVSYGKGFSTNGIPRIVNQGGTIVLGMNFRLNNGFTNNVIGRTLPCVFTVSRDAELKIGSNVGISHSAIICQKSVTIGDNVMIGANCAIYDTDFHPLRREDRIQGSVPPARRPVRIGDNAFIGAHTTILKGTRIGENSIIASCSLVSGRVPANQVWGGNPAQFLFALTKPEEDKPLS